MKWQQKYSTGNETIDAQHKTLFSYAEEFREVLEKGCSAETYEGFLEFLNIYCEAHFGFEEACMLTRHCEVACENKAEHEVFLKFINAEISHFEQHGFVPHKAVELLDEIERWLESHVCRIDVQLKDCDG